MKRNPWVFSVIIGVVIASISFFFWGLVTDDIVTIVKLSVAVLVSVGLLVRLVLR